MKLRAKQSHRKTPTSRAIKVVKWSVFNSLSQRLISATSSQVVIKGKSIEELDTLDRHFKLKAKTGLKDTMRAVNIAA